MAGVASVVLIGGAGAMLAYGTHKALKKRAQDVLAASAATLHTHWPL